MPHHFTYMWKLKNRINLQTKQKQTYRLRKHFDVPQMREEFGAWIKKGKGLRSTDWQLQNNHGDEKYRIENIVNRTAITMYGTSQVLEISGGTPSNHYAVHLKLIQTNLECKLSLKK